MDQDLAIKREDLPIKSIFRLILNKMLLFLAMLPIGSSPRKLLYRLAGINIGKNVFVSSYVFMDDQYPEFINIGNNVTISYRTTIVAHDDSQGIVNFVRIEDKVWIGACCTLLPGTVIGEGSLVGAGTVISTDVPSNVTIVSAKPRILPRS